jgi:alcohol dehydrogenase class IV
MQGIARFAVPTEVLYGLGASKAVGARARQMGERVLVVTDPGIISAGIADEIEATIKESGARVVRFGEVRPDPDGATIDLAARLAREKSVDVIVGLGGGSSIDVAKAVGMLLANGGESVDDYLRGKPISRPVPPLIAVPTTCGTGSEVTTSAVVLDRARKRKVSLRQSTLLCASLAVVDPLLVTRLPPHLVATTGMDALTHAIESYLSLAASPMTEGCALYAIELIGRHLRSAVANPKNVAAIAPMAIASTIAGLSFGQASTTLVHCLAHAVGGEVDVPHGLVTAILLAPVMDFNLLANPEKFARVAQAMGEHVERLTVLEAAKRSVETVRVLAGDLSIPQSLSVIGVKQEDVEPIVQIAAAEKRLAQNPRQTSEEDIRIIIKNCL